MSHFCVLVVGENVEGQLARFYEQGDANDDFMERVEEEIDLNDARSWLKQQRASVYTEACTYFTANATRPDGTVVDLTMDEDALVKEFVSLSDIGDGRSYNRWSGYENLPPLDADDETLAKWYSTDPEFIHGKWCNVYYSNPNAKWDWYQVGGRWSGFFKMKPSVNPEMYASGERSWANEGEKQDPLQADVGRKCDIDFEEMVREAEEQASTTFDKYEEVAAKTPEALTWNQVQMKFGLPADSSDPTFQAKIAQCRDFYAKQERVVALREAGLLSFFGGGEEDYLIGREAFVKQAGRSSYTPYAVLFNDVWYERGEMGWFGISHNEKDANDWGAQVENLLTSLPNDALLSIVDCHV